MLGMRSATGSAAAAGLRGGFGLVGAVALVVAPFLDWRDFDGGGVASVGLRGINSAYGREVLIGGVACCLLLVLRFVGGPRGGRRLAYAAAAVGLLALVPIVLFAAETSQLASLALLTSPTLRISVGTGLLLGLAGDAAVIAMALLPVRGPADYRR